MILSRFLDCNPRWRTSTLRSCYSAPPFGAPASNGLEVNDSDHAAAFDRRPAGRPKKQRRFQAAAERCATGKKLPKPPVCQVCQGAHLKSNCPLRKTVRTFCSLPERYRQCATFNCCITMPDRRPGPLDRLRFDETRCAHEASSNFRRQDESAHIRRSAVSNEPEKKVR